MGVYTVIAVAKDRENGTLSLNGMSDNFYTDVKLATAAAKELYFQLLEEFGLEDNGGVDENDESAPGGFFQEYDNSAEAVIYDYLESENECLSERVLIVVKPLKAASNGRDLPHRCAHCGEEMAEDESMIQYGDKLYHEECFLDCAGGTMLDDGLAVRI